MFCTWHSTLNTLYRWQPYLKRFYWKEILLAANSQKNCVGCLEQPLIPFLIRLLMRSLRYLVLYYKPFPFNSLSVQRNSYDLIHFWTRIKLFIIFSEVHIKSELSIRIFFFLFVIQDLFVLQEFWHLKLTFSLNSWLWCNHHKYFLSIWKVWAKFKMSYL